MTYWAKYIISIYSIHNSKNYLTFSRLDLVVNYTLSAIKIAFIFGSCQLRKKRALSLAKAA